MKDPSLETLTRVLPPPAQPYASEGDWNSIELIMKTKLPKDYKAFIRTYGSGKVCDFVSIMSPFVRNPVWSLLPYARLTAEACQDYVDTGILQRLPYSFFPEPDGLLPFGTTENGNYLSWHTIDDPDQWRLVIWDPGSLQFIDTDYSSLVAYLGDLVTQQIGLIPNEAPLNWFDPPRRFTPIDFDRPE